MSELRSKQERFASALAKLLARVETLSGCTVTLGEAYRFPWVAEELAGQGKGIVNSVHTLRLAVDLNLFVDGVYQADSRAYAALGAFWKSLDTDARWGGDFQKRPDGNHFSFQHNGVS